MKWEWLFLLLFYGLSMYVKRKQQKNANKEIEEHPEWDSEGEQATGKPVGFLETFLESQGLIKEKISEPFNDVDFNQESRYEESDDFINVEDSLVNENSRELILEKNQDKESNHLSNVKIEKRVQNRRSADKKYRNKKHKPTYNRLNKLFYPMGPLKQSIILKEILDKPKSLRKRR